MVQEGGAVGGGLFDYVAEFADVAESGFGHGLEAFLHAVAWGGHLADEEDAVVGAGGGPFLGVEASFAAGGDAVLGLRGVIQGAGGVGGRRWRARCGADRAREDLRDRGGLVVRPVYFAVAAVNFLQSITLSCGVNIPSP